VLTEALTRWSATSVDTSGLGNIQIHSSNLGGATLGDASGHTIWLDAVHPRSGSATGWRWFVDATPADDSDVTTSGNQGEQDRMDLFTVLEHEVGHLLSEHAAGGVMAETPSPGTRRSPRDGIATATPARRRSRSRSKSKAIARRSPTRPSTWTCSGSAAIRCSPKSVASARS